MEIMVSEAQVNELLLALKDIKLMLALIGVTITFGWFFRK